MKLYQLKTSQILPISLETAWKFFSNPANLSKITPPWLNFKVRTKLPDKNVSWNDHNLFCSSDAKHSTNLGNRNYKC